MVLDYEKAKMESWISGLSADYIDNQYEAYLQDPTSVEAHWNKYFSEINQGHSERDRSHKEIREIFRTLPQRAQNQPQEIEGSSHWANTIIDRYRRYGHQHANSGYFTPPLNQAKNQLEVSGLSTGIPKSGVKFSGKRWYSVTELKEALQKVYCGNIGFECMHIDDRTERDWLLEKIEMYSEFKVDEKTQMRMLEDLYRASELESYLGRQFVGQKRFSLEGGELLIGLIEQILWEVSKYDYDDIVIGMAHRGRLNVMVNTLGMSSGTLEEKFRGSTHVEGFSGDVKYHLGFSCDRDFGDHSVHIALAFNPSHLEAITPVAMGNVRARLDNATRHGDRNHAMALILHGDASIAGQGVVAESLNMAYTKANNIDGSIHVVVNNQIGFTTVDQDARSSRYCTDIAKSIAAPVLHVNGDDPWSVIFAAKLAADYKAKFKKDIFIDFVCFRKYGHNEGDEPSATQPLMYKKIHKHPGCAKLFQDELIKTGITTETVCEDMLKKIRERLKKGEQLVKTKPIESWRQTNWKKYQDTSWRSEAKTAVVKKKLIDLSERLLALPDGFTLQKQVQMMHNKRIEMVKTQKNLNWGMAEMLAYATLLEEGYGVRMQGQDCCRGTFAHRHAVYHDQNSGEVFTPLSNNLNKEHFFSIYNSVLSEYSTLGFEYGYSESDPTTLVIWEAQFGDFANNAQVIIDQFIASGWQKWSRMCGLVMLLPHGYEGMGPEHSSARLERFLQLCAQENFQVCNPTLPAQYFHMIRRQKLRSYRRPLVVMTPKSLLRHPLAVSDLDDLVHGEFQLILPNDENAPEEKAACQRLILCSGKVYYDLKKIQIERKLKHVHLVRIEQLYPFPYEECTKLLQGYTHLSTVYWCQEEPLNQGSWFTLKHRIEKCLSPSQKLSYVGREKMAAPASGDKTMHDKLQLQVTLTGLGLEE